MKKLYSFSLLFLTVLGLNASEKAANIEFKELTHDFGTIQEGEKPIYKFEFTNTGDAPLIINSVNKSCGCTEPEFSKEPIAPGETGYITVGYNSVGRNGRFDKSLTVNSNAKDGSVRLRITGTVVTGDAGN